MTILFFVVFNVKSIRFYDDGNVTGIFCCDALVVCYHIIFFSTFNICLVLTIYGKYWEKNVSEKCFLNEHCNANDHNIVDICTRSS